MVIRAFHNVQPRPRAQVASSRCSRCEKPCGFPWNSVQAIARSQAGSPTPDVPKSMTALSRPFSTSRLPGDVAVKPDGRLLPGGGEGGFPDLRRGRRVDLAVQRGQRIARLAVIDVERAAAPEIVLAGRRTAGRIGGLQRHQKARDVPSKLRSNRRSVRWLRVRLAAICRWTMAMESRCQACPARAAWESARADAAPVLEPGLLLLDLQRVTAALGNRTIMLSPR